MDEIFQFNIRVYAILYSSNRNSVLLSDEYREGAYMTKFPGGGLQFGEGTIDCLKREALEEFDQEIEVLEHFYTTDFFQKALFFKNQQLICIYYIAKFITEPKFKISNKNFDFPEVIEGAQSFRWIPLEKLSPELLTFPIDKKIVELIKKRN